MQLALPLKADRSVEIPAGWASWVDAQGVIQRREIYAHCLVDREQPGYHIEQLLELPR